MYFYRKFRIKPLVYSEFIVILQKIPDKAFKKYYCVDPGLRNARLNFRQQEEGHIMENIIYNELRNRGYLVDVGMIESREMMS